MKSIKKLISVISLLTLLCVHSFSIVFATENDADKSNKTEQLSNDDYVYSLSKVKEYVVYNNGKLYILPTTNEIKRTLKLDDLQQYFDILNSKVDSKEITIHEDLNITSNQITPLANYSTWTYKWWGAEKKFNNRDAKILARDLGSLSEAGSITAGSLTMFPPFYAAASLTGYYLGTLGSRVTANNKGRGVYVGITYAFVFNVEPL